MPIVEEGTNFPTALGRKNRPRTETRVGPIGSQAMALVGGVTPVHLAQRVGERFGVGERLMRLRRRGMVPSDLSVHSEYETYVHNLNAQLTRYPILPVLDRPHPVLDAVKAQAPMVPRVKLLGAFGIVDPQELLAVEKNIPRPYPRPMAWPAERQIGPLPAVISILEGPEKTVHPSLSIEL